MATSEAYLGGESIHDQVQFVNNQNYNYRGNPLPNQYHLWLRNHKNFSYGNTKNVLQPPLGVNDKVSEKKPSLEKLMSTFVVVTRARFNRNEAWLGNLETHMCNMVQLWSLLRCKLANSINSQQRGQFPSDTEANPKEDYNAITLRNGREIDGQKPQAAKGQ